MKRLSVTMLTNESSSKSLSSFGEQRPSSTTTGTSARALLTSADGIVTLFAVPEAEPNERSAPNKLAPMI